MSERDNQGKALLRLLQGGNTIESPTDERQRTSPYQDFASETSLSSALTTTDVRGAAAGEQYQDVHQVPTVSYAGESSYPLPRPGASAAVPVRSSGADLLRMLQGTPKLPSPKLTSQRQHSQLHLNQDWHLQQQYQHNQPPPALELYPAAQQQQQTQYQHEAPPALPQLTQRRSVAAEQERFLKKFLSIEGPDTEARHASPAPFPPTPASPITSTASEIGGEREGSGRKIRSRTKERGKDRGPRGGRGRGRGGGGGSGGIEDGAKTPLIPARDRNKRSASSARGSTETSSRGKSGQKSRGNRVQVETGGRESKKGWKGGGGRTGGEGKRGGGGHGGGREKVISPPSAYAWSSFQNSPDPKNIPIPLLSHFSMSSEASLGDESPRLKEGVSSCRDDMVVDNEVIHTPPPRPQPPPQEGVVRAVEETRSAAKRAEDDIKRMLRLG